MSETAGIQATVQEDKPSFTQGSEPLDDRIRRIVHEQFDDPTRYNTNFKAWIPKWIETQGVQLPISQVVGAYLTATDTINLGGDVNGRIGMVRGGTTPFDFTQVTFDSVYGKWVSNASVVGGSVNASFTTTNTSYASSTSFSTAWTPWRNFDVAGFAPQFRLILLLSISNAAHTASATLGFSNLDAGAALGFPTYASWSVTRTGATSAVVKDSNWQDIPSLTLTDLLRVDVGLKTSNAAGTAAATEAIVYQRYVSK